MQNDTLVAVDLAKSVFQVAVSHHPGQVSKNRRLSRTQFAEFLAQLPKATIVMEACGSAHFWARRMQALCHTPVLLSPHTVTPYVGRNKTDRNDTKGMLEAHRNEEIRPVPVKTLAQQALCSLHRIRAGWIAERTARINTLRGLLREFGIAIPVGAQHAVPNAWLHIEDAESELPDSIRPALAEICTEIRELERRIKMIETQLAALAAQTPAVARLMTIPGIGLIIATALVAFVGDIHRFPSARHFASYLGLTPKEHSTGSRRRLGAISKQGDVFLRTLLIHGAAPSSTPPRDTRRPIDSTPGLSRDTPPAVTTRQPPQSPTRSPASSGPSGSAISPSTPSPSPPSAEQTPLHLTTPIQDCTGIS